MFRKIKSWLELRKINQTLLLENGQLQSNVAEMKKRLRRAGMMPYEYFQNMNVRVVTAESIPYGNFAVLDDGCTEEDIEKAKEKIAVILAKGLIDSGLCQFIVHNDANPLNPLSRMDDPLSDATVGIKLYVIPWEQMTRRIVLFPETEVHYEEIPYSERVHIVQWLARFCRHIDNGDEWLDDEHNLAFFKAKMKQQFGWETDGITLD